MPTSTKNLTLDFMQTAKGENSSFKLSAILGLKYNHQNPLSHNFLVQFQNIKTNFVETVEISPELLRYKFKVGHTYKKGKLISKQKNEYEEFIEIDTRHMYEQIPFYKILSKDTINHILGNNDFHNFRYGGNSCYIHKEENRQFIIPSSVVALYYYFRSSSMKEAVFKGNPYILHDEIKSNIADKTDAILVLSQKAAKLDGPFIYWFLSDSKANKGFKDILLYISNFKSRNDINKKATNIIPIKALFPTKEQFNIKIRYIELPSDNTNKTTYLVNEIINDDSTLDFEKLTVLKAKKKDAPIDLEEPGLHIKGRKPRKRKPNVTTSTPAMIYGTNKIREQENQQNLSMQDKDITYDTFEDDEFSPIAMTTEEEKKGTVSVSFSKGDAKGDETAQQSSIEQQPDEEKKEPISKPPNFDIFLESIEFIEHSGILNDFQYNEEFIDIPISHTKSGYLTEQCSIHGRAKQYVTCTFEFNDINVTLLEVESEKHDFATWVIASKNFISESDYTHLLELRYLEKSTLQNIKETYNDISTLKFSTHRHAQVNNENEHEEVLERWLLRLLYKFK